MRGKACRIVSTSSVAPISTLEPIRRPAVPPSSRPPGPASSPISAPTGLGEAAERLQQLTAVLQALHRDENDVLHVPPSGLEDYCPETDRATLEVV